MLYNYFDDGGYIGLIGFLFLVCLFAGITIWIAIPAVKMIFLHGVKNTYAEFTVRMIVVFVLGIFSFFICRQSIQVMEYYCDYVTETYTVISGKLENVEFKPTGGRGEFYNVSFKVSDLDFHDTNISTSIQNEESIKSCENQEVTVYYTIEEEQQFVYKIEGRND